MHSRVQTERTFRHTIIPIRPSDRMATSSIAMRVIAVAALIGSVTAQCDSSVNLVRNGGFEAESFGGGK